MACQCDKFLYFSLSPFLWSSLSVCLSLSLSYSLPPYLILPLPPPFYLSFSYHSICLGPYQGVGIPQLIPHASPDLIDLVVKLLKYEATERITARVSALSLCIVDIYLSLFAFICRYLLLFVVICNPYPNTNPLSFLPPYSLFSPSPSTLSPFFLSPPF